MSGHVGIFWMVDEVLINASCPLEKALVYGDCLTFEGGHAEQWEHWQTKGGSWLAANNFPSAILTSEYDEHPRGRVVKEPSAFIKYADRRLMKPATLEAICAKFDLIRSDAIVRADAHYRIAADWS